MSYDAHLNDVEKSLLENFNAVASAARCRTNRYVSDPERLCTVEWLEAVNILGHGWVIIHKQMNGDDIEHIEQHIQAKDVSFFEAIYIMSMYEAGKSNLAHPSIEFTNAAFKFIDSEHYISIAEKSGIVFDAQGRPHPTIDGQIVGDATFPNEAYVSAHTNNVAMKTSAHSLFENILGKQIATQPHYFNETNQLQAFLKTVEDCKHMFQRRTNGGTSFDEWTEIAKEFSIEKSFAKACFKHTMRNYDNEKVGQKVFYSSFALGLLELSEQKLQNALSENILENTEDTALQVSMAIKALSFGVVMQQAISLHNAYNGKSKEWHAQVAQKLATKLYAEMTGVAQEVAKRSVEKFIMAQAIELEQGAYAHPQDFENKSKRWLENMIKHMKLVSVDPDADQNKVLANPYPQVQIAKIS